MAAKASAIEAGPAASRDLLKTLGGRVRDARARHGMTRRMLAHDSGISERYLAELESGRGNLSIVLLRKLASAIHVPLSELVDDGPQPPAEYVLLTQRLRRLEPSELARAASMIMEHFGRRPDRLKRIALIGLRGAGKTTLGTMLARRLGWEFAELSREIEREAGVALGEIFEFGGQAAYRRYELRALENIINGKDRIVLAAGGGLVSETPSLERLLDACYAIWLRASPREHWDRVINQGDLRVCKGTKDAEALADMRRILTQRASLYRMADAQLDTAGRKVEQSLDELIKLVALRQ